MSRAGVTKEQTIKAIELLNKKGISISVDAIRIELGNTGSKSTILKHLKEIRAIDEGAHVSVGKKYSISEPLSKLIDDISSQLQEEATLRIREAEDSHLQDMRNQKLLVDELSAENEKLIENVSKLEETLQRETSGHTNVQTQLQNKIIDHQKLELEIANLKERLRENERHKASIEEKYQQSCASLNHYREAVKTQREQDESRHHSSLNQLQDEVRMCRATIERKQMDLSTLDKECAAITFQCAQLQLTIEQYKEKESTWGRVSEELVQSKATIATLDHNYKNAVESTTKAQENADKLNLSCETLSQTNHQLELKLAALEAALASQKTIHNEIMEKFKVNTISK